MFNKRVLLSALSVFSLMIVGCGKEVTEVPAEWNNMADTYGIGADIATLQAQQEIATVLDEVNNHVLDAASVLSGASTTFGARGVMNTAAATGGISACKPSFQLAGLGAALVFSSAKGCFLDGTVTVKLFPLKTVIDLDVVGLKFVQGLSLTGEIALGGGIGSASIEFLVQNGRVNLNLGSILPGTAFTLSGRSKLTFAKGATEVQSRTNAFEANTRAGLALIAQFKSSTATKSVQSCFLTGGDGMNPEAGSLSLCFALIK